MAFDEISPKDIFPDYPRIPAEHVDLASTIASATQKYEEKAMLIGRVITQYPELASEFKRTPDHYRKRADEETDRIVERWIADPENPTIRVLREAHHREFDALLAAGELADCYSKFPVLIPVGDPHARLPFMDSWLRKRKQAEAERRKNSDESNDADYETMHVVEDRSIEMSMNRDEYMVRNELFAPFDPYLYNPRMRVLPSLKDTLDPQQLCTYLRIDPTEPEAQYVLDRLGIKLVEIDAAAGTDWNERYELKSVSPHLFAEIGRRHRASPERVKSVIREKFKQITPPPRTDEPWLQ